MNSQPEILIPVITIENGHVVTSSVSIANYFSKRHDDMLKKIRNLECSPEFHARNFAEVVRDVPGGDGAIRKMPAYEITRDGFAFLGMGFTGAKAAKFKEAYINAFNQMEAALLVPAPAIPIEGFNCRVLHTYDKNGVIINSRVAKDDEQLTSPGNFAEAMKKRGYVMVRTEDFKSLIMS